MTGTSVAPSGSSSSARVGVKRKLCVMEDEMVEDCVQIDASKKVKTELTPGLQTHPQDVIGVSEGEAASDIREQNGVKTMNEDNQNDREIAPCSVNESDVRQDESQNENDEDDDDLDSDSEISEEEAERLRQTIADLKEECARLTEERRRIEEEEEKRRRERDRLAAEISRVKAEFVRLKAECDRLKRHLAKQEEEIARLRLYLMIAREIKKKATMPEE